MKSINVTIGRNRPSGLNVSAGKNTTGINLDILSKGGGSALVSVDTTAGWNSSVGFIPKAGEIIVYSDYTTVDGAAVPAIKIGDGGAYVQDLPFVGDDIRESLLNHINDQGVHLQPGERDFWNDKINIDDNYEVVSDSLVFNRN